MEAENYLNIKDLHEKLGAPRSTVAHRLNRLNKGGLIELDKEKTKLNRSLTITSSKIYVPTKRVLEYEDEIDGLLFGDNEKLTGGPMKLDNLHGDLVYTYRITSAPDQDYILWDKINKLKHGTIHKIKKEKWGTIEVFQGNKNITATFKPRIEAITDIEEVLKTLDNLARSVYADLVNNGYELEGLPERKGQGKWTIIHPYLPDEYIEGDNFLIDKSQGEKELHPRTGDYDTNTEMTKMLTEVGYMAKVSKKMDRALDNLEMIPKLLEVTQKLVELDEKRDREMEVLIKSLEEMTDRISNLLYNPKEHGDPPEVMYL